MIRSPAILLTVLLTSTAHEAAAHNDKKIEVLEAQVALLTARLDRLELKESTDTVDEVATLVPGQPIAAAAPAETTTGAAGSGLVVDDDSWLRRISWSGDLRYRYEYINEERDSDVNRQRIRARTAITARVNETVQVGIGLASGGPDPVSTNQTLGGGGTTKDSRLDLAYFDWSPSANVHVRGGKFKNPFERPGGSSLLYDADWRPEGAMVNYADNGWFATALASLVESEDEIDSDFGLGFQGGYKSHVGGAELTVGVGLYDYPVKGRLPLFDPDDGFGNTLNPDGTYRVDYREIEAFFELELGQSEHPVRLFGHYVNNTEADEFETGWLLGGSYARNRGHHPWQLGYWYQDLEADAVLALLTDSDFAGGGTDGKGHKLTAAYGLGKRWKFNLTYFLSEKDSNAEAQGLGMASDFDRLQVDLNLKY